MDLLNLGSVDGGESGDLRLEGGDVQFHGRESSCYRVLYFVEGVLQDVFTSSEIVAMLSGITLCV